MPVQETEELQVTEVQWCSCFECLYYRNNEAVCPPLAPSLSLSLAFSYSIFRQHKVFSLYKKFVYENQKVM